MVTSKNDIITKNAKVTVTKSKHTKKKKKKIKNDQTKQTKTSVSTSSGDDQNTSSMIHTIKPMGEWKPVKVDLDQDHDNDENGEDDYDDENDTSGMDHQPQRSKQKTGSNRKNNDNNNHYDNPKLIRNASRDLPVRPGEDVAIFYGLEVLENYQPLIFSATKTTSSSPSSSKKEQQQQQQQQNAITGDSSTTETSPSKTNKKTKKHKDKDSNKPEPKQEKQVSKTSSSEPSSASTPINEEDHHPQQQETKPQKSLSSSKKKKKSAKTDTTTTTTTDASTSNTSSSSSSRKSSAAASTSVSLSENDKDNDESMNNDHSDIVVADPNKCLQVSQEWSQAASGVVLHPKLIQSLVQMNFLYPTPIQAATLSAAILGRRNLVGAAPTGSGKTLAFLLPILQAILEEQDEENEQQQQHDNNDASSASLPPPLAVKNKSVVKAIIVTPTRELATQIHSECDKLVASVTTNATASSNKGWCASLVGGIALVKQKRILQQKRPPIIIGTPGRLWAMISSGEHDHLKDLSKVQFLVLDEADRMTQDHCFPQLLKILDTIHQANPRLEDELNNEDDMDDDDDNEDEDRMLSLPGIRGEAPLMMLNDDILQKIQEQKDTLEPETKEVDDEDFPEEEIIGATEFDEGQNEENGDDEMSDEEPRVHRQTFIYSATLTLPFTKTSKPAKKRRKTVPGLDGAIAEILEKTQAMGETKIVDLSSTSSKQLANTATSNTKSNGSVRLPPGLSLEQIKCTQKHKDSHLFAYLMTTSQGASGPCLVFCNSIAAVRRVGTTLQTLGLSVRMLHANMQQRARFKAVESLSESNKRCVVVCTDVAARGLDIPSVTTIVHYDIARTVDTFVHRSGRTARGIGAGAVGSALSLISPAEDKAHSKICEALQVAFKKVLLDGRLLTAAQERVNLASKIVSSAELQQKSNSHNRWFLEKAKEADLDIDDDLLENDENRSEREKAQLKEAEKAKVKLAQLLQEPMKTQRFGKFLSTNSAAMQPEIKPIVSSPVVSTQNDRKGKRKR